MVEIVLAEVVFRQVGDVRQLHVRDVRGPEYSNIHDDFRTPATASEDVNCSEELFGTVDSLGGFQLNSRAMGLEVVQTAWGQSGGDVEEFYSLR